MQFSESNQLLLLIFFYVKINNVDAEVVELADATDSKSVILTDVWVRVPPSAPFLYINDHSTF